MNLVFLYIIFPLHRHICVRENRLNRTLRLTCTAIDTLIGMDVELVLAFIDTVDWANLNTTRVVRIDTGLGDDIGHGFTRLSRLIPATTAAKG